MPLPAILLAALIALTVGQILHFHPLLAEEVISHWGPDGPDGWLERDRFFLAMVLSEVATAGLFLITAAGFPGLSRLWFKLPEEKAWLAPERRAETVRYVRAQLLWGAVIIQGVMILLWQSTINANLLVGQRWPANFWWTLGVGLPLLWVWVARFTRRLRKGPPR